MRMKDTAGKRGTNFLIGKRVTLGLISEKADLSHYADWVNDQETTRFLAAGRFPVTAQQMRRYVRTYALNKNGLLLGIYLKKSKKHIGNISLTDIQWKDRYAEIGILVGDKRSRGKGYGTEAIRLLVEHAFDQFNLNKLRSGTISGNWAALRAFRRIGFQKEGLLRQHFFMEGTYRDCILLGLLRSDYKRRKRI